MKKALFVIPFLLLSLWLEAQPPLAWAFDMANDASHKRVIETKVCAAGGIVVLGAYSNTLDLDPSPGYSPAIGPGYSGNLFLAKYSNSGGLVWYKTFLEPESSLLASCMNTDSAGFIYIAGQFSGTVDVDPGPATFTLSEYSSGFLLKLDANGNFINAVKFRATASGHCRPQSISIDSQQNIYVTGDYMQSVDFDPGWGWTCPFPSNGFTSFVVKLNSNMIYRWAKAFENSSGYSTCSVVDRNDNILFAGQNWGSVDMDPGPGVFMANESAGYLCTLDSNGKFADAKLFYGSLVINSIVLSDGIYIGGSFSHSCDVDPGTALNQFYASNQQYEGVFLKLDSAGNFQWAKRISPTSTNAPNHYFTGPYLKQTRTGELFLFSHISGTYDFDPGAGQMIYSGGSTQTGGGFVYSCYDKNGNYKWVAGIDEAYSNFNYFYHSPKGSDITRSGEIYSAGIFLDTTDFDPGTSVLNFTPALNGSYFLFKLSTCLNGLEPQLQAGPDRSFICKGENAILFASGADEYVWSHNLPHTTLVNVVPDTTTTYHLTAYNVFGCEARATVTVEVNDCTSISETLRSSIETFPNPTDRFIWLKNQSSGQVKLTNIAGTELLIKNVPSHAELDLEWLPGGIYIVKFTDELGTDFYSRLIKN